MKAIQADITTLKVDAIVNAANETLLGGGGVDGAIHRAAGPKLLEVCRAIPEQRPGVRCLMGMAKITPGFNLPAQFVIHTVGPVWHGGDQQEEFYLTRCYDSCFNLAEQNGVKSIAFPAISTGAYGFPADLAAKIAVTACREVGREMEITFACYDAQTLKIYQRLLGD